MGFPGQEYQSGLPFPSPGDLPYPGIEPMSPALAGRFFTTEPSGKPRSQVYVVNKSVFLWRGGVSVYFLICQMEIILFTLRHVRCEN